MRKFTPYPFSWEEMPIDISHVFSNEKPAGRHGFLKVDGDKFSFADGTPARFWGTNLNSAANFPDFEFSEKTARRLAKTGVNIVRFHQLDSEWSTPNIFQFEKGPLLGSTRQLDPASMNRLDYLIYCLKKEGIYCYFDMITYRKFKTGDGVENAGALKDCAKPYSIFSRRLIDLQKEFAQQIWHHINPFTGLAYKDDPVFVMAEITNECNMFSHSIDPAVEPYYSELVALFGNWLSENKLSYPGALRPDFNTKDETIIRFKMAIQESYYLEMAEYMRGLGVKFPLAGTNQAITGANSVTQNCLDFTDGHTYWSSSKPWQEFAKLNDQRPMVKAKDTFVPCLTYSRTLGKPYFVSEWDVAWPNDWRADVSIHLAALGALQGWSGFTIHTYRYDHSRNQNIIGKEIVPSTINNVAYREGVFATHIDPAKYGLFYHAALIMRRGDVAEAKKTVALEIKDKDLASSFHDVKTLALRLITEQNKTGLVYPGQAYQADQTFGICERVVDESSGRVLADTGEMMRDWAKGYGVIDTERSKCAYGFLGEVGQLDLIDLSVQVKNDYAVLALSSLTDAPISQSNNLLLTTVGRAENTDMKYSEDRQEILDFGKPPIQIEVIAADVSLKTDQTNLRVLSIGPEGFITGVIPSVYADGQLKFSLGETCYSMYYLIQTE